MSYPAFQQFDWYESINRPMMTTLPSSRRRGGWTYSTYANWSVWRERRRLIATKKKREGKEERYWANFFLLQSTVIPKNKSYNYFLPWESSFECFFFANSFLLYTTYFGPMLQDEPTEGSISSEMFISICLQTGEHRVPCQFTKCLFLFIYKLVSTEFHVSLEMFISIYLQNGEHRALCQFRNVYFYLFTKWWAQSSMSVQKCLFLFIYKLVSTEFHVSLEMFISIYLQNGEHRALCQFRSGSKIFISEWLFKGIILNEIKFLCIEFNDFFWFFFA